jgi:prepilin-type N-terminal cleavage/methylation domain-containing protein
MRRQGFVLIELALVIVVAAIIAAFAVPRVSGIADAAAVRDETARLVAALDAARGASLRLGVVTALALSDTAYTVTAVVNGDTLLAWRRTGPWLRGVTLTGTGQAILFGPAGLALGVSNRTLVVGKGNSVRRIVVSRLGRLTY